MKACLITFAVCLCQYFEDQPTGGPRRLELRNFSFGLLITQTILDCEPALAVFLHVLNIFWLTAFSFWFVFGTVSLCEETTLLIFYKD